MSLFEKILEARGLKSAEQKQTFLYPEYGLFKHDPFLLPDMSKAVDRLVLARQIQEKIVIYGDYDVDGLTATAVLLDAFEQFGFDDVEVFIPNRFVEGYGLTIGAVEEIAQMGAKLIVTVDCGSLSEKEIIRAGELGVEVIVTDHHNVAKVQPPAVAVVNPKRLLQDYPEMYEGYVLKVPLPSSQIPSESARRSLDAGPVTRSAPSFEKSEISSKVGAAPPSATRLYPFLDLAGVGVAFKLVQALQTRLEGLPEGQEKWLLDLVALGTISDIVKLVDENRAIVYWGLQVLAKTRRPGLRALMAVSGIEPGKITARSVGFGLAPRMNATGRLETALHSLELLRARDNNQALEQANLLDEMNRQRRAEQDRIFEKALEQAENYLDDAVLVVSGQGWSHGIIGIVAAKLLEKYQKPVFALEEMGASHEAKGRASGGGGEASDLLRSESEGLAPPSEISEESKGSARSYGDFSAADAIRASDDIITKGGGHKMAAGVTLPTKNIDLFRQRVNQFYESLGLVPAEQRKLLLPTEDVVADFSEINEELVMNIAKLEPFGSGNPQPIIKTTEATVTNVRRMGQTGQHLKLELRDLQGSTLQLLAFSAPEQFFVDVGQRIDVWYEPNLNEWNGFRSVEGRLLRIERN